MVPAASQRRRNDSRFTALLKRGGEGGDLSNPSRMPVAHLVVLITRVCSNGSGPGLTVEKFWLVLMGIEVLDLFGVGGKHYYCSDGNLATDECIQGSAFRAFGEGSAPVTTYRTHSETATLGGEIGGYER